MNTNQILELKTRYAKYSKLVNETLYLDHAEGRGKKGACTKSYRSLVKYIESITKIDSSKIIFRLDNGTDLLTGE